MHGQLHLAPRLGDAVPIGNGAGEIAAEADERLGLALQQRLDELDRVVALLRRRLEAVELAIFVHRRQFRLFRDADGALSLHVGMAAHGIAARPRPPDIAAQQQQIDQRAYGLRAMDMLRQPHAVDAHHRLGAHVSPRRAFQIRARHAGLRLDLRPVERLDRRAPCVQTVRVFGEKGAVEHARPARREVGRVQLQHMLGDARQRRDIAARRNLHILARQRRRLADRHLPGVLRIGELDQPALFERIEHDDLAPTLHRVLQRMQDARRVGAGVLPDIEDRVADTRNRASCRCRPASPAPA